MCQADSRENDCFEPFLYQRTKSRISSELARAHLGRPRTVGRTEASISAKIRHEMTVEIEPVG